MTDTIAILQLMHTVGIGSKTLRQVLDRAEVMGVSLSDIVSWEPGSLISHLGIKRVSADGLGSARDMAERQAAELAQHDVRIIATGSTLYPKRLDQILGKEAPPVLFAHGNAAILDRPAVAFSGARHASDKGLEVASDSATALAALGTNVVSGFALGVDETVHRAAIAVGGVTTIVLAEGILQYRQKSALANLMTDENCLIISEFPPQWKWIARNAMRRNGTICGLCHALIVVEAGRKGGTRAAGEAALKLGVPLFVVEYANPPQTADGNIELLKMGGKPLRSDQSGRPSLGRVIEVLNQRELPMSTLVATRLC